jgi:hypothetical protein
VKKKFLASLLAVAVVSTGALTMVACDGGSDKQVNNPSGVEAVHTDNGGVEITNQQNSGIRVMSTKLNKKQYAAYGVSNDALSAYTLTATVTPADMANFAELEWTAEWYRSNVSWVEGEDVYDYVRVTANGNQAVIECLKGWDEPVIIKASLKDNPGVFGSCWCAYICRYGRINATMEDGTLVPFQKDEVYHFSLEKTIHGKGQLIFTGMEDEVGTSGSSVFDLSMEINDVLAQKLQGAGFTLYSNKVVYGNPLYDPQLSLSRYGYETMLYLPGADVDILGATQSNLIKQGYLWAISGADDDGKLSDEERVAYNKYREAVIAAWNESDDFMITLTVTQYDSKENMIVLRQYHTQMDFVADELLPELTVASVALDQSNLDF